MEKDCHHRKLWVFLRENEVLIHSDSKFVEFLLAETFESRKYIQLQGRQIQCVVFQMQAQKISKLMIQKLKNEIGIFLNGQFKNRHFNLGNSINSK